MDLGFAERKTIIYEAARREGEEEIRGAAQEKERRRKSVEMARHTGYTVFAPSSPLLTLYKFAREARADAKFRIGRRVPLL